MLRTSILGLVFLGLSACAHEPVATPAPATAAAKADADDQTTQEKKSIFESQTKEDVEKLNQVDKSLYEVSGAVHPEE